ncbi:uncharacterized protein LOC143868694 [Tasmannia lanceolata]|uniref:uncharacterized protein LOC143868694 n=1 Tax=Tasmannia lanceolata TaxID=3420 RepID=UPI004063730F
MEMALINTEADYKRVTIPYDDAVVICLVVANFNVSKILIDTGRSINILHCKVFDQMGIVVDCLTSVDWDVYGFSSDSVKIDGQIDLVVTFVQVPSTYSTIIGRPALNELQAVVSTPHLKMKFPTPHGIGVICGDQNQARSYYYNSLNGTNKPKEAFHIDSTSSKDKPRALKGEPVEELSKIQLFADDEEKTIQIGFVLIGKIRTDLINFLRANKDVFAWSASDMPGIYPEVIVHKLNVDTSFKPVKQKKWNFTPERQAQIKEEVDKLLKANFIKESHYPE